MEVALLNVRITFQKNAVTKDAIGNHKNEWIDYYSCYATVLSLIHISEPTRPY